MGLILVQFSMNFKFSFNILKFPVDLYIRLLFLKFQLKMSVNIRRSTLQTRIKQNDQISINTRKVEKMNNKFSVCL